MFDLNITFVFQFINFFLLLYCLYRIGYKPISEMMEKRRQTIQDDLDGAEKDKQAAAGLKLEYEAHLLNARQEARDIIEAANQFSEKTKAEIIATARSEAERLRIQAEEQIGMAREKALAEIRGEVVQLSVQMAEKIIAKELDSTRQDQIINEVIGQLDRESIGKFS